MGSSFTGSIRSSGRSAQYADVLGIRLASRLVGRVPRNREIVPVLELLGKPPDERVITLGDSCRRGSGLERLAAAGIAEQAQAFQVITPAEVVCAVVVIAQLTRVVLPETDDRPVAFVPELEAEGVLRPRLMPADAFPAHQGGWLKRGDPHVGVEITGEGEMHYRAGPCLGLHDGGPPSGQSLGGGQRREYRVPRCGGVEHMVNGLQLLTPAS